MGILRTYAILWSILRDMARRPTVKFKGIKKAAEYERGELVRDVLKVIGAGVVLGSVIVAPGLAQVIDYFDPRGPSERRRIWRAIKYLEEKNSLRIRNENGEDRIYLTNGGKLRLSEDEIWDLQIKKPWRWDHKWRLVMFDLPAQYEKTRRPFREKLQDFGFLLYQKSIFIYPYECQKEVLAVAELYGVRNFIRYVVAEEISDIRKFAREFDLLP